MIKYFSGVAFILMSTLIGFAQPMNPVSWEFQAKHIEGKVFELHFNAEIEGEWNIYSQYIEEGGPVPTSFIYDEQDHFKLIDKNKEVGKKKEGFDELFEMDVIKFGNKVAFVQKIDVNDPGKQISGQVEFMVCNNESCLPPKMVDFTITLPSSN